MFRRVLTYPLILALAAGPLLCCCTTGRLLASTTPHPAGLAAPTARIASPCCAHKHQPATPNPDQRHDDQKPAPSKPGEKCPCKDSSDEPRAVQPAATTTDVVTLWRAVDLVVPFVIVDCTVCPTQFSQQAVWRASNAPSLSTADLLFAHHNLRC